MSKLTKRQREIKTRYIRVDKVLGGYQAELWIDNQAFSIGYIAADKRSAEWTAKMLAIALDNLISQECAK